MAGLQDYLAATNRDQEVRDAYARLPVMPPPAPAGPKPTWIGGGLAAGLREMVAGAGGLASLAGKAVGSEGLARWGSDTQHSWQEAADKVGRPDLNVAPWKENGASTIPWAIYGISKSLPTLAAMFAGGAGGAAAAARVAPGVLSRVGAAAPTWLGGGGSVLGPTAAGMPLATATGQRMVGQLLGGAAASYPGVAGGINREAEESGVALSPGGAATALAAAIPSSLLGAVQPQVLRGIVGRSAEEIGGHVAKRIAAAGVEGGLAQVPIAGAQAAIESSFRPDMTLAEKAGKVVDAAITGGALGGVMGAGAGALGAYRGRRAQDVTNQDLAGTVDAHVQPETRALPAPEERLRLTGPSERTPEDQVIHIPSETIEMGGPPRTPVPETPLLEGPADPLRIEGTGQRELWLPPGRGEAPPPVDADARPLARAPMAQLEAAIANADQIRATRPLEQAETDAYQAAVGERNLRAQERVQRQPELGLTGGEMFPGMTLADYYGEEAPRARYQHPVGETPAQHLERMVGKRLPRQIKDAPDVPAALEIIDQAAERGSAAKWVLDAARQSGLEDWKAGTLDAKIADAQRRLADLDTQWRGEADPATAQRTLDAERIRTELFELQTKRDYIAEMYRRRDEVGNAVSEQRPERVDVREPAEAGRAVAEGDAQGQEIARPKGAPGEWFGEAIDQDLIGFSRVPAAQRPPEAADTHVLTAPRSTTPGFQPLADAPFAKVMERVNRRLGAGAENLIVVPTVADLPERVRQAAAAQGIPDADIRGTYHEGKGYIVRENIRNEADAQEVALHEMFGHGGSRQLMGREAADRMIGLFDKAGGISGVLNIARRFGAETDLKPYLPEGRNYTDADKVRVFDEMLAQATGKADGTLKLAALSWAGQIKQQLIKFLEGVGMTALARRMDTFTSLDTAVMLRNMRKAVQAGYDVPSDPATSFNRTNTVHAINDSMVDTMTKRVLPVLDDLKSRAWEMSSAVKRVFASPGELAAEMRRYFEKDGNDLTAPERVNKLTRDRTAASRLMGTPIADALEQVSRLPDKVQKRFSNVLSTATYYDMMVGKDWDAHPHLHNLPNAAELKAILTKLNQDAQTLRRDKYGPQLDNMLAAPKFQTYYNQMAALRKFYHEATDIDHASMSSMKSDPLQAFLDADTVHPDMPQNAAYMRAALDAHVADGWTVANNLRTELNSTLSAEQLAALKAGETPKYTRDQGKLLERITSLESVLQNAAQVIAKAESTTYAHLGRSGDSWAGGKFVAADPKILEPFADELHARGFGDVRVMSQGDNGNFFVRLENMAQAENLRLFLEEQVAKGRIQKGSVIAGTGAESHMHDHVRAVPAWAERLIQNIRDKPQYRENESMSSDEKAQLAAARDADIQSVRDMALSLAPADSYEKLVSRRLGVHGFSGDYVRNQAKAARASISHATNMWFNPRIYDALNQVYDEVRSAERGSDRTLNERADMKMLYNELFRRQTQAPVGDPSKWGSIARSGIHTWLTAASPAYSLVQLMQTAVMGWPELSKHFGYMPAGMAMAKATPLSFNIMRVAMKEGMARNGLAGAADMRLTRDVLEKAGVTDKAKQDFLIRRVNDGTLEVGSSRVLGGLADANVPGWMGRTAQYANAMGFGAEAVSRLITANALYDLAKAKPGSVKGPLDVFAIRTLDNSMFNWDPSNTSRALNPQTGPLGPATGVAAVFLRFQSMLIEKLYREMGNAFFGQAETPAQKAEARKFLAGHVAALTVLGGTMSLPLVSVLARAADKLVDMTGEEGDALYDVKAAWRGFLTDVLGRDIGEIAARGLPRAAGLDLSGRIGEQDVLPFSRFIADRRKAEDTIEDLAVRLGGAGVGATVNMFTGLNDIFNHGDVLQGMIKVLPTALRGPAMAYRMGTLGYADEKNVPFQSMTPGARAIAMQAAGFTPSEMAEYREDRTAQLTRKTDLETTAGLLRKHYATAVEQGDQETARAVMRRMQAFDAKNPFYATLPSLGPTMVARQRDPIVERVFGTVRGSNYQDQWVRDTSSAFNWRNQGVR